MLSIIHFAALSAASCLVAVNGLLRFAGAMWEFSARRLFDLSALREGQIVEPDPFTRRAGCHFLYV